MDRSDVDLRRLRYFVAVCDHGGFSRASHSIGIAQPSLTRQIKLLEKEVGIPLVVRTGRGAEPTGEGQYLLDRSRAHLNGIDEAVRELKGRSSGFEGEVALGVCPTIAPLFVADIRTYLRNNHPKVSLNVVEAYSGDLMNLMHRGQLDLCLTYKPSTPEGLHVEELFSERLVFVTSYDAGTSQKVLSLAQIQKLKLILPSGMHELRAIIDGVFRRKHVQLVPDLELDSLNAVKAVVAEKDTQYSTILPYNSVRQEIADRRLSISSIDDDDMMRTIAIVTLAKAAPGRTITSVLSTAILGMSVETGRQARLS